MTVPDGEVAVRQNGQEHAVAAPEIDGQVLVDVDGAETVAHVPPETAVVYHDDQDDLAADGYGRRTEMEMRGFALPEQAGKAALLLGGALLTGAGTLLAEPGTVEPTALAALVGGGLLTYIGARTAWSDRTTGSDRNRSDHE